MESVEQEGEDVILTSQVPSSLAQPEDNNANVIESLLESTNSCLDGLADSNSTLEDDLNDLNMNEAASEDSGMSSVDNLSGAHSQGHPLAHPGMLVMPTSPISVTTASMSASDDMIENENEMLRDRVADLEKRVHDQNDEITCLRATLADCLRRINSLESNKTHTMVSNMQQPRLRRDVMDSPKTPQGRRPMSGSYSQDFNGSPGLRAAHEAVNRRASYASNRDKLGSKSSLYQSTSSLHASEQSSSPAPSPSPTTPGPRHASPGGHRLAGGAPPRPLSASLHKKWSSNQDFRELSPGPNQMLQRRAPSNAGSMASLRSPFGSQQNLSVGARLRHGTKEAQWSPDEGVLRMHLRGRVVNLVCPSPQLDIYSMARVGFTCTFLFNQPVNRQLFVFSAMTVGTGF